MTKLPDRYSFRRGKLDACVYYCEKTQIVLLHHIDDFDVSGPDKHLNDLLYVQLPKNGVKLKVGELEYPGTGSETTSEFLGRTKINLEDAVVTKPNTRHTNEILKKLGLEEAKASPVPGRKLDLSQDKLLEGKEKDNYASCVGSAIYLSEDRADIKFSVKELAKRIRDPRVCDMQNLKVLGRYLKGTANYGHVTKVSTEFMEEDTVYVQAYCDSDWAGDVESRKSTSGECLFVNGTMVESCSKTQEGAPATSSGEAELRSLTQCCKSAVFIKNLCQEDFGLKVDVPRVWCDSSAAIQAAKRLGVGKMRHVSVGHLYVREMVRSKQVIISKISGVHNPADILTKFLKTGNEMMEGAERLGLVNLTKEGLDKHISKLNMTSVGAVDKATYFKKWKPQQVCSLSIRQYHGAILRDKSDRVIPHGSGVCVLHLQQSWVIPALAQPRYGCWCCCFHFFATWCA